MSEDKGYTIYSILDLPEPVRSKSLAALGKTAEEYKAYTEGLVAAVMEERRAVESGEVPPPEDMHYGDDFPDLRPALRLSLDSESEAEDIPPTT